MKEHVKSTRLVNREKQHTVTYTFVQSGTCFYKTNQVFQEVWKFPTIEAGKISMIFGGFGTGMMLYVFHLSFGQLLQNLQLPTATETRS
jgi:hypothetical protein